SFAADPGKSGSAVFDGRPPNPFSVSLCISCCKIVARGRHKLRGLDAHGKRPDCGRFRLLPNVCARAPQSEQMRNAPDSNPGPVANQDQFTADFSQTRKNAVDSLVVRPADSTTLSDSVIYSGMFS